MTLHKLPKRFKSYIALDFMKWWIIAYSTFKKPSFLFTSLCYDPLTGVVAPTFMITYSSILNECEANKTNISID